MLPTTTAELETPAPLTRSAPPRPRPDGHPLSVWHVEERQAWNALVLALPGHDLRQGYEWGEIRAQVGWRTYRFAVLDGMRPVAAIAVGARAVPGVPCAILYASRGPLIDVPTEAVWRALLRPVRALAADLGAVALRVSPAHATTGGTDLTTSLTAHGFQQLPDDWTAWNAPRIVMTLDVTPTERDLARRMRDSTRLGLTRALKHGVVIDADASLTGVARLHRLLVSSSPRKGIPVRPLTFFTALHHEYLARGHGCVLLARLGEHDLAGLLAVRFGARAYLLYSAVDADRGETRTLRPGTALHWELIRWAKANGCTVLDWGGSGTAFPPVPTDPGFGVYDFKRGFGCELGYLPGYFDLVFQRRLYGAFRTLEGRALPVAWKFSAALRRWASAWPRLAAPCLTGVRDGARAV